MRSRLYSAELFAGMSQDDIDAILDKSSMAFYPLRSWLYRQGETATEFFLVESGLVKLTQVSPGGDEILVRFVRPCQVFGYFSLAQTGPNIVSASVISPARVAVWSRETAIHLFQRYPRASLNLFSIAVNDIVFFQEKIRRLLSEPVAARVQWALAQLADAMGETTRSGVLLPDIGHKQLAELAGTTIYTVSRELSKLQRSGILHKERGRIIILQSDKLVI